MQRVTTKQSATRDLVLDLVERCAHGQPRHPEVGAQLAFRRNRVADRELLDEVEDEIPSRGLLCRHALAS